MSWWITPPPHRGSFGASTVSLEFTLMWMRRRLREALLFFVSQRAWLIRARPVDVVLLAPRSITVEELKKLVRQWKLHEVRGFWKTHPEKEDLIRALLNHMDDMNEIYNYEKATLPSRPTRPQSSMTSPSKNTARILKPYHGDLFGHTENTMGIIYLSRYDSKKVDLK